MSKYFITLTFEAPSIETFHGKEVFRLKCTASDGLYMPDEIFCHNRTVVNEALNESQDEFSHIASPYELSIYPANAPTPGQSPAYFRKSTIDILLPSVTLYQETKTLIQAQVSRLLDLQEKLDLLETSDTVMLPTSYTSSSES